jgi:TatD DNase family protein
MLSNISYYRFFDTHCHLNLDPLNTNIVAILKECQEKKVFVNCVGADFNSSIEAIKIARQYPQQTICSVGIHPEYVDEINKIDELEEHIKTNIEYIFGLGECGLDYHIENYDKQKQINLFKLQIELAIKYKLPLIVHCRDAYEDLYEILKEYNSKLNKILIHCYDTDEH